MNTSHIQKQVDSIREMYITRLFPDVCQLIPSKGTGITIGNEGYVTQTPATAKQWRGSTNIPCRVDVSRAFRPDDLKMQTSVVDEYNLQLPHDIAVDEDDKVHIGTAVFEIRKLKQLSEWDYTVEALIMRVSTEIDE